MAMSGRVMADRDMADRGMAVRAIAGRGISKAKPTAVSARQEKRRRNKFKSMAFDLVIMI